MKRAILTATAAVLLLAACDPQAPYSDTAALRGGGVGFGDYQAYMRAQEQLQRIRAEQRQAEASRSAVMRVDPGAAEGDIGAQAVAALRGGAAPQQGAEVAQGTQRAQEARGQGMQLAAAQPSGSGDVGAPLSALAPDAPASGAVDVSDQSFTPVPFGTPQQNRIVERDFVPQVRVESVPQGAGGPNLFAYALSTSHNVGDMRFNRSHPLRWRRWEAACAEFRTQDAAQEAFLAAGGPERDPNHLDPDGDGFACWWDPAPFREAARAARLRAADLPDARAAGGAAGGAAD